MQSAAGVTDQRPAVYKLCAAVYKLCAAVYKRGAAAHKVLARWCAHTRYLSIKQICGGAIGCYCCINLGPHRADSILMDTDCSDLG